MATDQLVTKYMVLYNSIDPNDLENPILDVLDELWENMSPKQRTEVHIKSVVCTKINFINQETQ